MSLQLSALLQEMDVFSVAKLDDLPDPGQTMGRFSIVLIHKHAAASDNQDLGALLLRLSELAPDLSVAILSDTEDADDIVKAFGLGIRGYIPISLPTKHAADAVRLVESGGSYVPSSVLSLSATRSAPTSTPIHKSNCAERFTPRQMEVLQSLWQGKQNKTIAYDLDMCESTVKVHIRHIMKKLNARNRTQIVLLTRSLNDEVGASIAI